MKSTAARFVIVVAFGVSILLGSVGAVHSDENDESSVVLVDNVVESWSRLRKLGDWMGYTSDLEGVGLADSNHNQGIARRPGAGTPYFLVTRSFSAATSPTVAIVSMSTRPTDGERLRSNRLRRDTETRYTPAPMSDRVRFESSAPSPTGQAGDRGLYKHPGATQIVDDIAPLPLEQAEWEDDDPAWKVSFMDLSSLPDSRPGFLDFEIIPKNAGEDAYKAGAVAFTRLPQPDGHYLLALAGGDGTKVRFYKSTFTDIDDFRQGKGEFLLYDVVPDSRVVGGWPTQDIKVKVPWPLYLIPGVPKSFYVDSTFQTLNFIQERGGALFLAGFLNTRNLSPTVCELDQGWLYRVEGCRRPVPGNNQGSIALTKVRHDTFRTGYNPVWPLQAPNSGKVGDWGSGWNGNFNASACVHVTPTGELVLYAIEHYVGGPGRTVRMSEFRDRDVYRHGGPNYAPTVGAGGADGRYEVDEGSRIDLRGIVSPPRVQAWAELYADSDYRNVSMVFEVIDQAAENWERFTKLDTGIEFDIRFPRIVDWRDGFNDQASSVRWFAPPGAYFTLFKHDNYVGTYKVLPGSGRPDGYGHLKPFELNDEVTSIRFRGDAAGKIVSYAWSILNAPPYGFLRYPGTIEPEYHAVEGTYVGGEPGVEEIELSATSNLLDPAGEPTVGRALARVTVHNLPPDVSILRLEDQAGRAAAGAPALLIQRLEYTLFGEHTDPGVEDTHTADVAWGDGHTNAAAESVFQFMDSLGGVIGTARVPHVYADKGTFTITLSVEDDDGDASQDTLDVRVLDLEDVVRLCIEHLRALLAQGSYSKKTTKALTKALGELEGNNGGKAKNGVLAALAKGQSSNALLRIRRTILEILTAARLDPSLAPALSMCPHMLALAAKSKALEEIDAARSRIRKFVDLGKVLDAEDHVAAGDASLAAEDYVTAVWQYERACRSVKSVR